MLNVIKNQYLFIAELNGYKVGTVTEKVVYGQACYENNILPTHLHERIWAERLYNQLQEAMMYYLENNTYDGYHWSVPIELDATASMLSYMGALLGDKRLLTMCNAAGDPEVLQDAWSVNGLTREQLKKVATPRLYGSSQPAPALWDKNNIQYTKEDVKTVQNVLKTGAFAVADAFKEFIIQHVNPSAKMNIKIGSDNFEIECNRWSTIGEVPVKYDLYDTDTKSIKRVTHMKTKLVPNLKAFKRYFPTLLIHNLDSQVANKVAEKVTKKYGFCVDIHDAFIVSPLAAQDVRQWYAEELTTVYKNRKEILTGFMQSVGVLPSAMPAWNKLMEKVDTVDSSFICRLEVLK